MQYLPSKSMKFVKFGTDTDKYGNWFSKINIKELVCHLKEFEVYITLHYIGFDQLSNSISNWQEPSLRD